MEVHVRNHELEALEERVNRRMFEDAVAKIAAREVATVKLPYVYKGNADQFCADLKQVFPVLVVVTPSFNNKVTLRKG